ncbi:hypothetical protein BH09PSE3_BH09PSE3_10080 [soil metagenome]
MIGKIARCMIGSAADKDEAAVAIAAIGISALVDLKPNPWVAQSRRNFPGAIANDARAIGTNDFWLVDHNIRLATR